VPVLSGRRGPAAVGAAVLAALGAVLALGLQWRGVDWPAQLYRVQLFRHYGWVGFDFSWYGGHYPLAYSVLFPPLAAVLGVGTVAVASAAGSAWAFDRVVRSHFGSAGRVSSLLFAAGTLVPVAIGQLPFLLGVAFGLAAVVAYRANRLVACLVAAAACGLTSSVAAGFLAMAAATLFVLAPAGRRLRPALMAAVATAPLVVVTAAYRQGGTMPIRLGGVAALLGACAVALVLLPPEERALRMGTLIYAAAAVGVFLVPSPVGGNIARLGTTVGVPLVIGVGLRYRRTLTVVAAVPLLAWQWTPALAAMRGQGSGPTSQTTYFAPLLAELGRVSVGPARLEIPFTLDHWEAAWVAPTVPLARGWMRQLDRQDNPLFYETGPLDPARYHAWLDGDGVSWVALPDVALDPSATAEAALLAHPQPWLRPVWHDAHWRLWAVADSPGLVSGPGHLTSLSPDAFTIQVDRVGPLTVRVRYSATMAVDEGGACLSSTPEGWTVVDARRTGPIQVGAGVVPRASTACS